MSALTILQPVVLANDDFEETSLKTPYVADGFNEFDGSQSCDESVHMERVSNQCSSPMVAPSQGEYDSQGSYRCESGQPVSMSAAETNNSTNLDDSLIYLGSHQEQSQIEGVIQRLVCIFRGLPRDMFINKIVQCYGSSERLETIRADLFQYIKGYDEFPYGASVELKRRVQTRAGDPLVSKLSKDIYCLVSVIEGADYADLTDLMSLSRHGKSTRASSSSHIQGTQYLQL